MGPNVNSIEVIETAWIPMPDGTQLAARLWLPPNARENPAPCLLEYIPYRRRDRTRLRDETMHPRFAEAGYASIRVDIRGNGDSGGLAEDEYSHQETQDGVDVIAWLADQPWCDGNVGMFGKSWGAYNSFQVAAKRPPALKAIAPVMGCDDRWREDIHFYGGVLAGDNFWWGSIMQLLNAFPPDPEIVGEDNWRDIWRERLEAMEFWPAMWLEHQTHDEMWRRGSICEDYDAINVPVYYFGGWADLYRDTPLRIAKHLNVPVKTLMGPWAHLYPHEGKPGPQVDFVAEVLRFWDYWLKGIDTGVADEPPLRFYMLDSVPPAGTHLQRPGSWVEEPSWPSPNVTSQTLWLNSGSLDAQPERGAPLKITSPQTFGSAGGDMCSFAIPGDMPLDCRIDAAGALVFQSDVLEEPLNILGQPEIALRVSVDQPQAFVAALLIDEAPDGAQTLISRGFFNLMHRGSDVEPDPVVPGKDMDVTVPLHAIGYRVPVGHRVMVQIATAYWPVLWPAPKPVTATIFPGTSALSLPVRTVAQDASTLRDLPVPASVDTPTPPMRGSGGAERTLTRNADTGRHTERVCIDGGVMGPSAKKVLETGTEISDISERTYSILPDDPLSATATMTQETRFQRGAWDTHIKTWSQQTATATDFVIKASVECWDGEELFFKTEWDHVIPRNGM